jgi:hypothetical protein
MIDRATSPLLGSKAAVKESERNRVQNEAVSVVTDQTDETIATLKEGMTFNQVRDILGEPSLKEFVSRERGQPEIVRWTYKAVHRVLLFADGRLTSIAIR